MVFTFQKDTGDRGYRRLNPALCTRILCSNSSLKQVCSDYQVAVAGMGAMDTGEVEGRWRDLDYLLLRPGNIVGPGFEPAPEVSFFPNSSRLFRISHDGCSSVSGV